MHILIGVTGSVATIKLPLLVQQLRHRLPGPIEIRIVTTERGRHFIPWDQLRQETILGDNDEWAQWTQRGDPVLHIEVGGRWDSFVACSADDLARNQPTSWPSGLIFCWWRPLMPIHWPSLPVASATIC